MTTTDPTTPILEVHDLVCGYDSFLLRDIDFSVAPGALIGIIGPNGSGKTSLLRAVTRVLKPKRGRVLLQGRDIRHLSLNAIARQVAVVSQNPGLAQVSVEEFVLLGRTPHHRRFQFLDSRKDLDIAQEVMALTGALEFRQKLVGELSGGERQLCLVARALAQEPKLLLLDEPTAFLDIGHQVRIMDLIRRLNRDTGLTVMMVLHDLNLAGEYCSRLLLMKEGRIHESGTPAQVLTYQTIEEVYQTLVVVGQNPVSARPYIFPVPEQTKKPGS